MIELTILMPCLNEETSLPFCIREAQGYLDSRGIAGEILVADNGSADSSADVVRRAKARVVRVLEKGYGAALHRDAEPRHRRHLPVVSRRGVHQECGGYGPDRGERPRRHTGGHRHVQRRGLDFGAGA